MVIGCTKNLPGTAIFKFENIVSVSYPANSSVATFQNGRRLTFNPIYFANEFGDPQFYFHLNISFSLSNKYADFKKFGRSNVFIPKRYSNTELIFFSRSTGVLLRTYLVCAFMKQKKDRKKN